MTATRRSAPDLILDALKAEGDRTVAELASAAGIGRSTAGKALAALERADKVRRTVGAREGARRSPDRWSLTAADASCTPSLDEADAPASGSPAQHVAAGGSADQGAEQDVVSADAHAASETSGRLRPGQLDGLVLDYLTAHPDDGPVGPGVVAKALGRSSGAVGNCLARLAAGGRVRLVDEHPRRYRPCA